MKDKPVHFVHYEGCKDDTLEYNRRQYEDMFDLFAEGCDKRHFIIDRPHVGESVWAKLYKQYDGSYVFDLERDFIIAYPDVHAQTLQFFIFDTATNMLDREAKRKEGYSYNQTDIVQKQLELDLYVRAAEKSSLNTRIIWLDGSFDEAYEIILQKIKDFAV